MNVTFGDPTPAPPEFEQSARIVFCTQHFPLKWSHCSSSADFLSQFYAGILSSNRAVAAVNDLCHSISYMANELVENAVKFRTDGDVDIETGLDGSDFLLRISNWISAETSARFQTLLAELTSGDPGELLIQRIEANAADHRSSGSGLGLLTLMNDYGVRVTWTFQPADSPNGPVFITTLARLTLPKEESATERHHGN
jgi:hypothetical protein